MPFREVQPEYAIGISFLTREVEAPFGKYPYPTNMKTMLSVLVGLLVTIATYGLQLIVWDFIDPFAWMLYYPAVIVASLLARYLAGLITAILEVLLISYAFLPPRFSFILDHEGNIFIVLSVAITGIVITILIERMRRLSIALASQKGEARFQRAIEEAPFPIMIHANDGSIMTLSHAWTEITGYRLDDIPTIARWTAKAYGEEGEIVHAHIQSIYDLTERKAEGEFQVRCKDGSLRIWEFSSVGLGEIPDGRKVAISIAMDVTERKASELTIRESELNLLETQRIAQIGSYVYNIQTGQWTASDRLKGIYGIDENYSTDLAGWINLVEPQSRQDMSNYFAQLIHENGKFNKTYPIIRPSDGEKRWVFGLGELILGDKGNPIFLKGVIQDVTQRKEDEDQLRKLSLTVQQSPESIVITNLAAEIEYVNEAFTQNTGYSREEVIGQNPRILQSGRSSRETYKSLWDNLTAGQPWRGEFFNKRKDGSEYVEFAVITPIRDTDGTVTHYVAVKEDITDRKVAEANVLQLAFYDPLTSLPNRRLLLDRLQQALILSERNKKYGALMYIDLDNFKSLNDSLGHDTGDLLLKQVASRLIDCVRASDTVSRFGGDEYVIMLEELSHNQADAVVQASVIGNKVLQAFNNSFLLGSYQHYNSASIGITTYLGAQEGIEELLKRADLAMYDAKAAGRNTLRFFDAKMQEAVNLGVSFEAMIRQALERNWFELYFQPKIGNRGEVTGAEALLRLNHPQQGLINPDQFIPVAEHTGLILPIGHWVLNSACDQLARWAKDPLLSDCNLAVNVSAAQFHQPEFVENVQSVLERTGANPSQLRIELTESMLLGNIQEAIDKMSQLQNLGLTFSLDDFGTGYSSLSYLKRLPLYQIKIDQSFISDVPEDSNACAITRTIIDLGRTLGFKVIAEGVETNEQLEFLKENGCHNYQGYLFSRPLPLIPFMEFIHAHGNNV